MSKAAELRSAILTTDGKSVELDEWRAVWNEWKLTRTESKEMQEQERKRTNFIHLVTVYASEWHRRASNHISDAHLITEIVAHAMQVDLACLPDEFVSFWMDTPTLLNHAIEFVDYWVSIGGDLMKSGLPEPTWLRYKREDKKGG